MLASAFADIHPSPSLTLVVSPCLRTVFPVAIPTGRPKDGRFLGCYEVLAVDTYVLAVKYLRLAQR